MSLYLSDCNCRALTVIYASEHLATATKGGALMRKEEFYILELDEEFIIISISDRGAQVVKRGYNSRQEALDAFPQAA